MGAVNILNPAPTRAGVDDLVDLVDVLVPNEHEAAIARQSGDGDGHDAGVRRRGDHHAWRPHACAGVRCAVGRCDRCRRRLLRCARRSPGRRRQARDCRPCRVRCRGTCHDELRRSALDADDGGDRAPPQCRTRSAAHPSRVIVSTTCIGASASMTWLWFRSSTPLTTSAPDGATTRGGRWRGRRRQAPAGWRRRRRTARRSRRASACWLRRHRRHRCARRWRWSLRPRRWRCPAPRRRARRVEPPRPTARRSRTRRRARSHRATAPV